MSHTENSSFRRPNDWVKLAMLRMPKISFLGAILTGHLACLTSSFAIAQPRGDITVIGEIHGNTASIQALRHYVGATAPHERIAIGLELPVCAIQNNAIVYDPACTPSVASDGRLSKELQDFIAQVTTSHQITLFGFDDVILRSNPAAWEANAARIIRQQAQAEQKVIALTGNYHARKTLGDGQVNSIGRELGAQATIVFVTSLKNGTSRVCTKKGCGVQEMRYPAQARRLGLTCTPDWSQYDCEFVVSRFTASTLPTPPP